MAVVVKDRVCRECSTVFQGGPRAWYCPSCREIRKKESLRKHRLNGTSRPLGSTDLCIVCGAPYIVNSSRQKYCKSCSYDAIRAVDRPASRAWNHDHKDTYYPAKNAKRNADRAANPEPIREKERAYRKMRREHMKAQNLPMLN